MTFALILRHWKLALAGVLLIVVGVQTIRIEHLQAVVAKLKVANKALRLDLDNIKDATAVADRKAREAKAQAEAEYKRKAEETDREYQADLADARARAARYAAANRVRSQAAGGQAGGAPAAADSGSAQGANGQGDDAGVVVTRTDFDTLVDNTLRLKAAHEWACQQEGAKCD